METENMKLWEWLRDERISQETAAREIGITVNYLNMVLLGKRPLTGSVKFSFIESYPATAAFLLPHQEKGD